MRPRRGSTERSWLGPNFMPHDPLTAPRKLTTPDRDLVEALCGWTGDPEHRLSDDQVACLWQLWEAEGLVASMGVGLGKSLISLLAASVAGCSRPVIAVKPNLVQNLLDQYALWQQFFGIRPFQILKYSTLSTNPKILWELAPDILICDEAQALKHMGSARAIRGLSYIVEFPKTKVVVMSGTITTSSVADYAHLAEAALRDGSPVPHYDTPECGAWARVLGARPDAYGDDFTAVRRLITKYPNDEKTFTDRGREAMRQHLDGTRGVILTNRSSCAASLDLTVVNQPQPPGTVVEMQLAAQADCVDPDGKGISTVEQDLIVNQLQYGFWYRKVWNSPELEEEWRQASSAWNQAVNKFLSVNAIPGLDSPALVRDAVIAGNYGPAIMEVFDRYAAVSHVAYKLEPVWVWRGWMDTQLDWLKKHKEPAILWFMSRAVGAEISKEFPVYAHNARGDFSVAHKCGMSIAAMREGHNLQAWSKQRACQFPTDAGWWQQLLGRTHRQGQRADEVFCDIVANTSKLRAKLKRAIEGARYIEKTTGERQRLTLATVVGLER